MANPSVYSTNAKAQDSALYLANHRGGDFSVASVTTTTVVLDDASPLTGIALYATATPGMLVIKESADGAANHGLTTEITGITSNTLTVADDFATATELADGDIVTVIPPLAVQISTNGGHSISETRSYDESMGLSDTSLTHITPLGTSVGGDISVFATVDSMSFARLLLAGTGGYNKSATGVHDYIPFQYDDGTYAEFNDFTIYAKDGNGIVNRAFYGMFGTQLTINVPSNAVCTASLSTLGNGVVREVGGAGKTFDSGNNKWIEDSIPCDNADRFSSIGALFELGGSFGDAITDSRDKFLQNVTVTISREGQEDPVLGNQFNTKADEGSHMVIITGTRILENDTYYENSYGTTTSADPELPTATRALLVLTTPSSASRTLTVDVPRGIFTAAPVQRQRGKFTQDFTFTGLQTLDGDDCPDTANPLYRMRFNNGIDTDLGTALY